MRPVPSCAALATATTLALGVSAQPTEGNPNHSVTLYGPAPPPPVVKTTYYRRPLELVPELAAVMPLCVDGQTNERCDGLGPGGALGLSVFWRVTPHFAWGGGLGFAGYTYDPPESLGLDNARAGAAWLMLRGRYYFTAEGLLDPYVELGLGGAAQGSSGTIVDGPKVDETSAGPALSLAVGLDMHVTHGLRIGPFVGITRVFVDKIRRCRGGGTGDCIDVDKDKSGHLSGQLTGGARFTILFGEEL